MTVIPTLKQKRAAKAIAENALIDKPRNLGEVLAGVGYGKIVQDPRRITESIGFKQALHDLGLTEELITTSLVSDIRDKPKNRLGELKLGAELLGMVKKEDDSSKENSGNTYNFLFNAETQASIAEIESKIKARLIQSHDVQEN